MTQIIWQPLTALWLVALMAVLLALPAGLALLRRQPGRAAVRLLVVAAAMLVLLSPVRLTQQRAAQDDIGLIVMDRSDSMALADRSDSAEQALQALTGDNAGRAADLQWRIVEARNPQDKGTLLHPALQQGLGQIPAERLAGVIIISDGVSADAAELARLAVPDRPIHVLIAGDPGFPDRQIDIVQAPVYAPVGSVAEVTFTVAGATAETSLPVQVRQDGQDMREVMASPGQSVTVKVPIERRGETSITLQVPPGAGELVTGNNQQVLRINGVRGNLRVLLVSGAPSLSGRLWRDMLKADPAITLVHFTILRFPTSFDPTPTSEMSLIPFPVEQLFEERLPDFDLVIFDRFDRLDLLPSFYLRKVRDYVAGGGALLLAAGSELAEPFGLAQTSLGDVLPVVPTGQVIEGGYRPQLTPEGRIHPVTAGLLPPEQQGQPNWGRWQVQVDSRVRSGDLLMTGSESRPLLVLDEVADGRVGILLSADVWRWARGLDGGGPRDELLRRVAHWLMREPDLESTQLVARAGNDSVDVTVTSLTAPSAARLTGPSGATTQAPLRADGNGRYSATIAAPAAGLYRIDVGPTSAVVDVGAVAELADVTPTDATLRPLARASGGGVFWLNRSSPQIRRIDPDDRRTGAGWVGMVRNQSGALLDAEERPLLPPELAWLLLAAALAGPWALERR